MVDSGAGGSTAPNPNPRQSADDTVKCSGWPIADVTTVLTGGQSEFCSSDEGCGKVSGGGGGQAKLPPETPQQLRRPSTISASGSRPADLPHGLAEVCSSRVERALKAKEAAAVPCGTFGISTASEVGGCNTEVNILVQDAEHTVSICADFQLPLLLILTSSPSMTQFTMTFKVTALVDDLHEALFARSGFDPEYGYLVYGHTVLRANTRLFDYGIRNGSVLFLHARLRGGGQKRIVMDDDDWDRFDKESQRPPKRSAIPYMEWLEDRNREWLQSLSSRRTCSPELTMASIPIRPTGARCCRQG